jgi:hypothetical protein
MTYIVVKIANPTKIVLSSGAGGFHDNLLSGGLLLGRTTTPALPDK